MEILSSTSNGVSCPAATLHLPLRKMNSRDYARSAILCQAKNRADGRKSPPAGAESAPRGGADSAGSNHFRHFPRSGPDDSLLDFYLQRSSREVKSLARQSASPATSSLPSTSGGVVLVVLPLWPLRAMPLTCIWSALRNSSGLHVQTLNSVPTLLKSVE